MRVYHCSMCFVLCHSDLMVVSVNRLERETAKVVLERRQKGKVYLEFDVHRLFCVLTSCGQACRIR